MIRRLHLLVLAAAATALLGAPSAASAASTSLSSATVSPGSGTTDTTFVFAVTFDGAGKFSTTSVTVSVAGRTLSMSRVSGTALLGLYRAATTLPAGTWSVTFNATVAQGPSASLSGPTVRVIVPATPVPTAKPTPAPTQSSVSGSGSSPTPSSVAMPAATPTPTSSSASVATAAPVTGGSGSIGGGGGTPPAAAPAGGGSGSSGGGGKATIAATPGAAASAKARGGTASGGAATAAPAAAEIDPRSGSGMLLLYALGALTAAIAVIGFLFLIPWRRRRDPEPAAQSASTGGAGNAASLADAVTARSVRRARLEQANDPILESMGLNPDARNGNRRASAAATSQVHRGPGVREPQRAGRRSGRSR